MATDKTYNGWTNYETWAVKLWIDNEQGSYEYWREQARSAFNDETADKSPNVYMNHSDNARSYLAHVLEEQHDSASEHPVFKAAEGKVYADLLNAALSEVNWHEISGSLLEAEELEGYEAA